MKRVLVATTVSTWNMADEDYWRPWITNAVEAAHTNFRVEFFAALQTNGTGLDPFAPLIADLIELGGSYMSYETPLDNPFASDAVGLNIATDYACQVKADWLLTIGASRELGWNSLDLLLAVNHPLVGGSRLATGPAVPGYEYPVEATPPDAWFCLTHSELFRHMRWREEIEEDGGRDISDCWNDDALRYHGIEGYARQDVHAPDQARA